MGQDTNYPIFHEFIFHQFVPIRAIRVTQALIRVHPWLNSSFLDEP